MTTWDSVVCSDAIHAAYESAKPRLDGMSFEDFAKAVQGFEVVPQLVDGKVCGAALINGPEIHFCIMPWAFGRWVTKKTFRLLNSIIDKHGEVITHANTDDGKRFVESFGAALENGTYRRTEKWALKQS